MRKTVKFLVVMILLTSLTTVVLASSNGPDASHTFPDRTKANAYLTVTEEKAIASTNGPSSVSQSCTIYYFNTDNYTYGSANNGSGGYRASGITVNAPSGCIIQYATSNHTASNAQWGNWNTTLQKSNLKIIKII